MVTDIGSDPSEAELAIVRRAGTLIVWREAAEADMARGEGFDIGAFTTATNALRRLLADIGLQRRAKDATFTIHDLAAEFAAERAAKEAAQAAENDDQGDGQEITP